MKEEEQERDREEKNSGKESKKKLIRGSIRGHSNLEAERVPFRKRSMPLLVTKLFEIGMPYLL